MFFKTFLLQQKQCINMMMVTGDENIVATLSRKQIDRHPEHHTIILITSEELGNALKNDGG